MLTRMQLFWRQFDKFTQTIVCINIIFYIVSLFKNHFSAITGLSKTDMLHTFASGGHNNFISIVTAMFSHASLTHLLMNMITLMLLSPIIVKYIPIKIYALTYMLSGIIGNSLTRLIHPNMVTMGASGAIYGMIGLLLVMIISSNFTSYFKGLESMTFMIFIVVGTNIFFTLYDTHMNVVAHLSGLAIGMIIAIIVLIQFKTKIE